jgi:hypothetical protein
MSAEIKRKDFLKAAAATFGTLFTPGFTRMLAEDDYDNPILPSPVKSVILINMSGGMSHVDTFDPKPSQTSFSTVNTAVSGVQFAETLRNTAREMKRAALVRSTWSEDGDHGMAQFLLQTSYRQPQAAGFPDIASMGAVISHLKRRKENEYFPSHVTMGDRGGMIGRAGFLGARNSGFHISNLDNPINYMKPVWGNFGAERLVRRGQMLDLLNEQFGKRYSASRMDLWQTMSEAALEFVGSSRISVFDIKQERLDLRAKFGENWFGKACLMAKRLAAAEVPFIQITRGGFDTHDNNKGRIAEIMKDADPAIAALLGELGSSGLLGQTLVVITSEFGRTPNVGGRDGRDHWPQVWTTLLAGGKIPGGAVVGDSGEKGEKPARDPAHWRNVAATIYRAAGIDPEAMLKNGMGRPLRIVPQGDVIKGLLG